MAIIAREISTKHFIFKDGCFIGEASELPNSFNPLGPIYDDACDAGFYLVSEKTGEKLLFTFSHTDGEEDVCGWNFKVNPTVFVQNKPKLASLKLLIIND